MFSNDRDEMRRFMIQAWRKACEDAPLEPLEAEIAKVARAHPEYHTLLARPDTALSRDFFPEDGETNPFLHMSLHLAVAEQLSTDRPAGIRALYRRVAEHAGTTHEAEHRIIDCLAQTLWEAQREGRPPDEQVYLDRVGRLIPASG